MHLPVIKSNVFIFFLVLSIIGIDRTQSDNSISSALCSMKADELIKYYGYDAETHYVKTSDGYILTVFRCNAKRNFAKKKRAVIVQHGLGSSSDDFLINSPNHALAYVLADAGYDVWLPNSRGNLYSREHLTKDPNDLFNDFWDFSWHEIGIYDQSAIIDYILEETANSKLYYIGHSQGTTSLLVLLSEKPEYNTKVYAASLMAPAGYMKYSGIFFQTMGKYAPILQLIRNTEFLPRSRSINGFISSMCAMNLFLCSTIVDFLAGLSEGHGNEKILPVFLCHFPSGASLKQYLHYGQEAQFGHFGKYMNDSTIPPDFPLSRITAPTSIHYSTADEITHPTDVEKLITKLNNSLVHIQRISDTNFNHFDFIWGMSASNLIYTHILEFFDDCLFEHQ